MSLRQFVSLPTVRQWLNPLFVDLPRPIPQPILVPRQCSARTRASIMGMAFDYALRFELGRRCPNAIEEPWVAYAALWALPSEILSAEGSSHPWKIGCHILRDAHQKVCAFRKRKSIRREHLETIACVALRLAMLDPFYRAGFNPHFWREDIEQVDALEVEELVSMLEHAPFDELMTSGPLFLNPSFGRYSHAVHGADADLVVADMLIDIKTTQEMKAPLEHLRQLCGYFLLARAFRKDDSSFPEITRLGIYFPRFGHVWSFPAVWLTSQLRFPETEAWFLSQLMAGRELAPIPLAGQPVKTWLRSAPPTLPPDPENVVSLLPSEETEQILLERAITRRGRAHRPAHSSTSGAMRWSASSPRARKT
jgi:hypothetical protein